MLRPSVLDPAGTAVKSALNQMQDQMQLGQVESVRIGKFIEMIIDAENVEMANQQINTACDRLLANPVIETYTFELSSGES